MPIASATRPRRELSTAAQPSGGVADKACHQEDSCPTIISAVFHEPVETLHDQEITGPTSTKQPGSPSQSQVTKPPPQGGNIIEDLPNSPRASSSHAKARGATDGIMNTQFLSKAKL